MSPTPRAASSDLRRPPPRLRPAAVVGLFACLAVLAAVSAGDEAAAPEVPLRVRASLSSYFDTFKLGPDARAAVDADASWSDAKQNLCLRLLARLVTAPAASAVEWRVHAAPLGEALRQPKLFEDRLVRIEGRAVFVAPVTLPPEQVELHARKGYDLVRIVADDGTVVDVVADAVPKEWKRWTPIDHRTRAIGLAVGGITAGASVGPEPVAEDRSLGAWPPEPRRLLVVANRVAWFPDTPLGRLGMDYGLFDRVVDGKRLLAVDADAFYAMLAAVGRLAPDAARDAARIDDPIPLIDARAGWMESHRGELTHLAGVARRATRIAVDDPARRTEIGADHYWELYVFVDTPPIKIDGSVQDSFPVACCVRRLPADMPHGETMSEWVEFDGFAMKQYAYEFPGADGGTKIRRETPLFIARQVAWKPSPSTQRVSSTLGGVFIGLAAVLAIALAAAGWSMTRKSGRRKREPLPDRVEIE